MMSLQAGDVAWVVFDPVIGTEGRSFRFIEHAPADVLENVRAILAAILGLTA